MSFWHSKQRYIDAALLAIASSTMHEVLCLSTSRTVPHSAPISSAEWMAHRTLTGMASALLPGVPVCVGGDMSPSELSPVGTYLIGLTIDKPTRFRQGATDGLATMVAYVRNGVVRAAVIGDVFYNCYVALKAETGQVVLHSGQHTIALAGIDGQRSDMAILAVGDTNEYPLAIKDMLRSARKNGGDVINIFDGTSLLSTMTYLWRTRVGLHVWPSANKASRLELLPIVAINEVLGLVTARPTAAGRFERTPILPWADASWQPDYLLTMHGSAQRYVPGMGE